jgi:hypothetical protein
MDTQRRWIAFDTFKLIVALILLALILVLVLQKPSIEPTSRAGQGTQVGVVASTQAPPSPTSTIALPTPTLTFQPSLTPTLVLPTATLAPLPTLIPTQAPPAATPASAAQPAPTETPQLPSATGDCPLAQPSRLAVGKQALVITNLNLRQDAGMDKPVIRIILPDSKVEIIGGPICTPYQDGAYLWWNMKTTDGGTGWSAEASLSDSFYFLQPIP